MPLYVSKSLKKNTILIGTQDLNFLPPKKFTLPCLSSQPLCISPYVAFWICTATLVETAILIIAVNLSLLLYNMINEKDILLSYVINDRLNPTLGPICF